MASSQDSGGLVYRNYQKFRGVDFSNRKDEVSLNRSPDALNVWQNYKSSNGNCVETRPDTELKQEYEDTIYSIFFFNGKMIVHSGTKLFAENQEIFNGLARAKSKYFIYETNLYIKDGSKYYVYNGQETKEVEGFIPTTTISKEPAGDGKIYQDVNLLSDYRKNQFCSDGTSLEYFLDVESFDSDYVPVVSIDGEIIEENKYTFEADSGKIIFDEAPPAPLTDGQDNVVIQFKKSVPGNREKIEKCTLLEVFDNRVFFSGNPDYPNKVWHCSLNEPSYCSDLDNYTEGVDDSKIKALVTGNNALWVFKEPSQTNTTIFYHNPTVDETEGKIYPSTHSSISTGCVSTGINFNDDICFFSDRGMEGISGDVTTEQVIKHKSSMVDNKLLNEENYKDLILVEWEGYLLVIIDSRIYLANSRRVFTNNDSTEYEWYYWEMSFNITNAIVKDGILYLTSETAVYTLTKVGDVNSYFTTLADEFGYPHMLKTTNKKGTVVDVEGEEVKIEVKLDDKDFTTIGTYDSSTKQYVKPRIKAKKFKAIQMRFSSSKPFSLYSCTLEAYIGNIVKR